MHRDLSCFNFDFSLQYVISSFAVTLMSHCLMYTMYETVTQLITKNHIQYSKIISSQIKQRNRKTCMYKVYNVVRLFTQFLCQT